MLLAHWLEHDAQREKSPLDCSSLRETCFQVWSFSSNAQGRNPFYIISEYKWRQVPGEARSLHQQKDYEPLKAQMMVNIF